MTATRHVEESAPPPSDFEQPHIGEESYLAHVPAADSAAGGGTITQGSAELHAETSLTAGGTIAPAANLAAVSSLTVDGVPFDDRDVPHLPEPLNVGAGRAGET